MITEAVLKFLGGLFSFVGSLMPTLTLPTWLTSATSTIGQAFTYVGLFGNWFPMGAIGRSVTFILACSAIALTIRFVRMGLSVLTGGGGGAA